MSEAVKSPANLTDRQRKWFASVAQGLERDTGKTLEQWVEIARTCPETAHRARLKWFKDTHGLMQNRASQVIAHAFESPMSWSEPDALIEALWSDPASRAIFEAVAGEARALEGVIQTARKGYTAWSRKVQFAAIRPLKGGAAMLGLAVPANSDPRLEPRKSESWSERLPARLPLGAPEDIDDALRDLLRAAWEGA
jgi:hypothetical protein